MIHVTEKAAEKIRELLRKKACRPSPADCAWACRAADAPGSPTPCVWIPQARDRDKVFEENGARIFVDPKSYLYLDDTTLDYHEDLMRQGFVFQNPQAARSCGCGSSFTA